MKKLKNITKRIATLGLAAVLTVNSFSATTFAAEESSGGVFSDLYMSDEREWSRGEPETAVIMEEKLQESNSEIITDAAEPDAAASDEEAGLAASEETSEAVESNAEGNEKTDYAVTPSTVDVSENTQNEEKKPDVDENVKQDDSKDSEKNEIKSTAFEESKSIDGVKITVSAEEGVFPKEAVLSVEKVTVEQEKQVEEAVEDKRPDEQNVAVSYTYDIKVLDKDGNEIQPADERKVKVSFKLEEVTDSNLETNIYHITETDDGNNGDEKAGELTAEKLIVETDGDTATAETDGFSLYTVEFTYNALQYVLPGDSEVALSEILEKIGLTGEASEVSVSDSSLFSAAKNNSGEWIVTALKAFSTKEWMKVLISGVEYEITVTDDPDPTTVTLTSETGEVTLTDGQTLTGEGGTNTHVTIADGATVTLSGVTLTSIEGNWAGITCEGDATIVLKDGTENAVKGGGTGEYPARPGIYIPQNKTLTIQGSGSLEVTGNGSASGIGGRYNLDSDYNCGNIVIEGGRITATGSKQGAGIGGYGEKSCGNITIKKGVTYLKATKGNNANNSIGSGKGGACGTVSVLGIETGSIEGDYIYDSTIQYAVKFDSNGGTGSMDNLLLALGEQAYLPACGFTKEGSSFYGWSTTANGYLEYDDGQRIMNLATENGASITLYPIWSNPTKNITSSTGDIMIYDGQTLTGTGGANTHVTIADGATVTLSNVDIFTNITHNSNHNWAGITCEGDATIILAENTTNSVKGGNYEYPGIYIPENKTLIIQGNGTLTAACGKNDNAGYAAGIGASYNNACGNIIIRGGSITAESDNSGAGIGGYYNKACGNITIEQGVTYVKATKGSNAKYSIGSGNSISGSTTGTCGKVSILGVETGSISGDYTYDSSIHYTVDLNDNGGTGSMDSFTLALGEPMKLPKSVFTKSGAIFGGWNTVANGDVLYKDEEIIRDLANADNATVTLYAIWKDPTETITAETDAITAVNGQILTGTGGADTHIIIADGATVTLNGLYVSSITKDSSHKWAALTCEGDATIILAESTENTLKGGTGYPCIYVPENSTLTIQGTGKLVADNSDNDGAAGIGAGCTANCGNIEILGGDITAKGGSRAAGIGSGNESKEANVGSGKKSSCGNITIVDATITATGGYYGAGIGSGYLYPNESSRCGTVTIASGNLNISKGTNALNSIGKAYAEEKYSKCGTVTIGGIVGEISESPYIKIISNETYTVNFDGNGGTGTMSAQTFNRGLEKSLTRNGFTRSGFAFIGWSETPDGDVKYKDCVKVMNLAEAGGSVTLYAKWYSTEGVPSGLQIDGDYTESDAGFYYVNMPISGATTSININDTKYYKFKIYDNGGKSGDYKVGTHGYLIISVPEGYRVKFSGNADYNGDLLFYDSNTVDNGKTCGGYSSYHNGSINDEPKTTGQFVTVLFQTAGGYDAKSGLDLTAQVVPVNYKVSFNANADTGISGTMEDQSFTYDEGAKALTQNGFTREGYIYRGWAASADGAVVYADKAEVSNLAATEGVTIELYAKWKKLLSNADITVEGIDESFAYTGNAITPAIVVKDGLTDITDQCDITYSNNTAIGTATVTITAKSDSTGYAGSTTRSFNIVHKHSFTYSANGAVLTATCNGKGTCELTGNKVAFTIVAPTLAVYGGAGSAEATLTGLDEFNTATGLNIAATSIKYVGRGDTTYIENATAPTEAGTYTASITAGGNTASVEYTIAQKEVGLEWSNTSLTYTGSPQKPTATATGLIEGDAAGVSVTVTGEKTDAGTNYTATATGLTGAKAGNYKLPSENTHSFSIGKAEATLSVGTASFEKAFGDEPFELSGITTIPADAALTYSVTDSKNATGETVDNNKVITVNASGTVTIVGAGTATVKIDLPESTNYKAAESKTISVTVSKKAALTIDAINKTYLYSAGGEDSITLSSLLPPECGAVSYTVATEGDATYSAEPTVTDGVLSYTVNSGEINKTGTITVTATTENYADITITVNVKLADQKPVILKEGTSVTLSKSTLTYGEALSTLTFKNTAVFVEQGNESNEIPGTIAWKNPSEKPAVGTTSAAWVFTPTDTAYAPLEGTASITVNKATPVITTVPTAAAITYGHTLANSNLENGAAKLGETNVPGTFAWSDDTIPPAVSDSNKTEYTVKFTPDDSGNYNEATCKVKIVVNKAEISPENITAPQPKPDLKYTGSAQELITTGSVAGDIGTMQYAIGTDTSTAPTTGWSADIPEAATAGTYYVWYKVIGDANHNDYVPETAVSVEIAKATYTGTKEASVTVRSGQATSNMTVALPALPDGASYGTVTVGGTTALISGTPTVNGTILTFSTTEQNDQTTATITIVVTGATNYNDYDVVVTVTAKAKDETVVTITGIPPIAIEYGDTIVLSGSVQNPGTNGTWTWTSSDSEVLRVTPDGANATIEMMKVGTATITAKYESDATLGEADSSLTVSPKQLDISWKNTSFTYDGTSHIPTATLSGVMSGDTCTVSVSGAKTDAGTAYTATASLSGTDSGNYILPEDKKTCSFTISKANIRSAVVTLGAPLTYTGSEQSQSVSKVELSGEDITAYCDVSNNKGTNAGSYSLTVTAKADSNYTGSVSKAFTIAKKAITPTVSVTGSYNYTGSAITPTYTVKNGNTALAPSDYTASIKDNINAGEGKLTITAATGGNYSFDTVTVSFTIAKAAHENVQAGGELKYGLSGTVALASYIEAGGSIGTISVSDTSLVLSGTPSISGTTLSYSFADNAENAGKTAVVTVPVKDCTNYADYSILVTLTVIDCAHEHTEIRNVKTATCTEQGYIGDTYCKDCGKKLQSGEAIPIAPDNHAYDSGVITKQPTIFAEGIRTYTCTRCHHTYTETVPKVDDGEDHSDLIEDITDEEGKTKAEVKTEDKEDGSKETTVTVGGQEVEKTVTDADGNETVETHIWIGGLKSSYTYTGSAIKPSFHVYDGTKKLISGKDYSVSYKNNKSAGDTATITISFKGNYKGTAQEKLSFSITPAVLGADVEATDVTTYASGKTLRPVPVMKWASTGKSIDKKNFSFTYKDSADTVIDGIKEAGQYKVVITSKNGSFTGETEAAITVTGSKKLLLSRATVKLSPSKYTYTGDPITPAKDSYTLKLNGKVLTEGTDYVVSVRNNIEPGKATIVFTAKDGNQEGYVGEKSATFTISKGRALKDGDGFTYSYSESVPYAKGGAKPTVVVKDGDDTLKAGTDYTVSYSKNTKVTNGATAVITIKGKGNYKGSVKKYFTITKQDISKLAGNIITADKVESKKGYKNPTVTITDLDGKKLKAGTDFAIVSDSYSGPDTNGVITATVSGKGNYTGTVIITYRYIKGTQQLSKVKVMKSLVSKTYTGREVRLTNADLTGILYTGSKSSPVYLIPGTDFKVVSYTNNTKTGTAKVTIQGIGAYGGTRTLSFKIIAKKGDYKGSLVGGEWTNTR